MIRGIGWVIVPTVAGCRAPLHHFEFVRPEMGTGFRIVLYAPDAATAERAQAAAFARIEDLNHILSDYDPKSELSRLSQRTLDGPMTRPAPVSDDLWRMLERSVEASRLSSGAFDITIGPCVKLWRRSRDLGELPTAQRVAEARESVGYRFVQLVPGERAVQLTHARMRLDVGGIAKGYAAGEALAVLKKAGISRALVGAAGDIAVGDPPPGREGWVVTVSSLRPELFSAQHVRLRNVGISTSGDTERFVEIDGRRYSHIIDPTACLGLTRRSSVSVLAPDATTADWMATAISILGPQRGLELVERTPGAAARIVIVDENQNASAFESRRFKAFVLNRSTPQW